MRDHPGSVHVIHKGVGRRRCIYPMLLQLHPITGRDLHNCDRRRLQQIRVEQCLRAYRQAFNVRDLVSLTLRSRAIVSCSQSFVSKTLVSSATQFAQYRKSLREVKTVLDTAWRESASQVLQSRTLHLQEEAGKAQLGKICNKRTSSMNFCNALAREKGRARRETIKSIVLRV